MSVRLFARIGAALVLLAAVRASFAQVTSTPPRLTSIVAIEEARSIYGRYRVIFELAEPVPGGTDTGASPRFLLGAHELRVPPGNAAGRRIHAYADGVPAGETTLRVEWRPRLGAERAPVVSELPVEAAALLAASQKPTEYEAPHVVRAKPLFDLVAAAQASDTLALGTFTGFDVDPENRAIRLRRFQITEVLRGAGVRAGEEISLPATDAFEYELDGRYLLFMRAHQGGAPRELAASVARIWRPEHDPLLQWVRTELLQIEKLIAGANGIAVGPFVDGLNHPVALVRYSAAQELTKAAAGAALTAEQRQRIDQRLASEPDPEVKAALAQLKKSSAP